MSELCTLHAKTGVGNSGEYLPPETDRQVGLGMLGLANLLRRYGVTYEQFGIALDQHNAGEVVRTPAYELAHQFHIGIESAAAMARSHNMVRAFAIAPLPPAVTAARIWMVILAHQKSLRLSGVQ